jgi:hypothetical protein
MLGMKAIRQLRQMAEMGRTFSTLSLQILSIIGCLSSALIAWNSFHASCSHLRLECISWLFCITGGSSPSNASFTRPIDSFCHLSMIRRSLKRWRSDETPLLAGYTKLAITNVGSSQWYICLRHIVLFFSQCTDYLGNTPIMELIQIRNTWTKKL